MIFVVYRVELCNRTMFLPDLSFIWSYMTLGGLSQTLGREVSTTDSHTRTAVINLPALFTASQPTLALCL